MVLQDVSGPKGQSHIIALEAGVDNSTVQRWRHNGAVPDEVRWEREGIPKRVTLTTGLCRLFGYYAAEGSSNQKEITFTFGSDEAEYIQDVKSLMKSIFNVLPTIEREHTNAHSMYYERAPVARIFGRLFGSEAHTKHLPPFMFELPNEYFLEFLNGEARGDGHNSAKDGKLVITSVSEGFIRQMNWRCRMAGIKTYVSKTRVPAGRVINGNAVQTETVAYRLGFGKTNNPFSIVKASKTKAQKRSVVKSIKRLPFEGFVYDICGADGEAFFGGNSPVLLHNTNRPNAIDPALRRPGRFDREIEIGVPDRNSRKEIIQIHTRNMPLAKDVKMDELADITHGYTGADIAALAREAAMAELRHILPKIIDKRSVPNEVLVGLSVNRADFMEALALIQPSALREVFVERPNIHWGDVGGLEDVKAQLKEAVELPVKNPEAFEKIGIRPVRGILLVGAPGTGKTMLAKAVATERESNFISIKGPELLSKYVGESEKSVREVFRKAKMAAPCIIFIDEIDAIASSRNGEYNDSLVTERVVDTLLTEMDGLHEMKNVVVLAATNRPDIIDPALLRPGRFDKIIEIPIPDESARLSIFKVHTKKMPLAKDVSLEELTKETENYTGAEIENVVREAGMNAIRNGKTVVTKADFNFALREIKPAIPKELAERIKRFKDEPENMYR
ncbi:MAG: AAA family ATPase [Candidatus Micrarchaeota archaeon]|nr:AAA family ATPase [Candidatus Micrarchaeota archaeon]